MNWLIQRPALRIALFYIIFAGLWIIFSDRVTDLLVDDTSQMGTLQTVKGIGFVLVTSLLLWDLFHRELKRRMQVEEKTAQLNAQLRRRNDELLALHQVGNTLAATLDIHEICRVMYREVIRKLLDVPHFLVALYDPQTEMISCQFAIIDNVESDPARFSPKSLEGCPASEAIRTRQHQVVDIQALREVADQPHWLIQVDDQRHTKSALFLPLISSEQVIGVMNLQHTDANAFQDLDFALMLTLATQMAVALENARLFARVQSHTVELEERVAERTHELMLANERLTELDRLRTKFIADVSHDLRGPVAALAMRLDLIKRVVPEKREQYLEGLQEQIQRLSILVEDVLDLSNLELSARKLDWKPVELNDLIRQVVTMYRPIAEKTNLRLIFELPSASLPVHVHGEYNQLSRLVANLISNAINYTPQGEVRVYTYLTDDCQKGCIVVKDTGIGIDETDMAHLFTRFYRGHNVDHSITPGTGLGLSIVKEIIDLHGGSIRVESQPGMGSTFTVFLPITPAQNGCSDS